MSREDISLLEIQNFGIVFLFHDIFFYYSKALFSDVKNFSQSGGFLQIGRKSTV